jgi:tetratricopeptide (TPR) repeat protein
MKQNYRLHWADDRVTITKDAISHVVKGKYADFIQLLLITAPGTWVDRAALCQLESWSANLPLSAGKQVARFLDLLKSKGLAPIIFQRQTDGWALEPAVLKRLSADTLQTARDAVASRGITPSAADLETLIDWYHANFRGMVAMSTGKAGEGYLMLRSSLNGIEDDTLFSISNVLATRIEQRLGTPKLPVFSSINLHANLFARAVEMRRFAAYALHAKSEDWPEMERIFRRHLAAHANSADFTTIAILHNALGVLLRRMEKIDGAIEQLRLAAPLAIFSGDIILAQNVAFNLANIVSEAVQSGSATVDPQTYLGLLEFDAELRAMHSIGRDSAQTELLLAYLHLERGDHVRARHYLDEARRIIDETSLIVDEALYHRTLGLMTARKVGASANEVKAGVDFLKKAEALYSEAGYRAAAAHVAKEMGELMVASNNPT